jgi:hypothetical protein
MKRTFLVAALLLGSALNAFADNNVWTDLAKYSRPDYVLQGDVAYCEQTVGPDLNGKPVTRQFKRCMLTRNWRLDHTIRERVSREHTWIDPDTGLLCKNIKIFGTVGATYCSND